MLGYCPEVIFGVGTTFNLLSTKHLFYILHNRTRVLFEGEAWGLSVGIKENTALTSIRFFTFSQTPCILIRLSIINKLALSINLKITALFLPLRFFAIGRLRR